jgi:hypothetical protein|tara:strand:+ start:1272 stop:1676 length:405 start_codon:yes stop_codon:yes gene_type:complete
MVIDFSLLILILFSDPAQPTGWDTTDVVLESLTIAAVLADWASTRAVLEQSDTVETNPLLNARPTDAELATFFVPYLAYNLIVPLLLPKDVRAEWYGRSMAFSAGAVKNNLDAVILVMDLGDLLVTLASLWLHI